MSDLMDDPVLNFLRRKRKDEGDPGGAVATMATPTSSAAPAKPKAYDFGPAKPAPTPGGTTPTTPAPPPASTWQPPPLDANERQRSIGAARPQDTVQMFSRLNPQVQTQVLTAMGVSAQQAQQFVTTIGQHPELQADNPNIVGTFQQLFPNIDVSRLTSTIFSDTVHPADADHNYANYGALTFDPTRGLIATPEAGQRGEVNRRGLRQAEKPLEILGALGLGSLVFSPALLEMFGLGGPEATAAAALPEATTAGSAATTEALLPTMATPEIGTLAETPAIIDPTLATAASPLAGLDVVPGLDVTPAMVPPPAIDVPIPDVNIGAPYDPFSAENIANTMMTSEEAMAPTAAGDAPWYDSIWNAVKKNPLTAAALGLNVGSQVMQNRRGTSAANQVRQAAAPISQEAQTLLAQYGRGELNPGEEFRINQWEQEQIAAARDLYGRAGMADSTSMMDRVSKIEQQAQAMRDASLQGLLKMGLQASGMALGPLIQAIELESQSDTEFAHAQAQALQALILMQAMGNSNTPGSG